MHKQKRERKSIKLLSILNFILVEDGGSTLKAFSYTELLATHTLNDPISF